MKWGGYFHESDEADYYRRRINALHLTVDIDYTIDREPDAAHNREAFADTVFRKLVDGEETEAHCITEFERREVVAWRRREAAMNRAEIRERERKDAEAATADEDEQIANYEHLIAGRFS